jgi:hypothetical protein
VLASGRVREAQFFARDGVSFEILDPVGLGPSHSRVALQPLVNALRHGGQHIQQRAALQLREIVAKLCIKQSDIALAREKQHSI